MTNPGDPVTFRVETALSDAKFFWTVSAGTIIEGQGTSRIKVATDRSIAGSNVTATIDIGKTSEGCERFASATAPIAPALDWEPVDYWGDISNDEQRSRLDTFFAELSNNPHNIGLIILRTRKNEPENARNRRVRLVSNHISFRKFDRTRIWFCFDRLRLSGVLRPYESNTFLYRFPPELANERPYQDCRVLKATEVSQPRRKKR